MAQGYKTELERERRALGDLLCQREQLATKIAKQQTRVAALAALCETSEEVDKMTEMDLGGLTNACRTAFRAAGNRGLMPTEVRGALERLRFPTQTHKNILASIHTVIPQWRKVGKSERRYTISTPGRTSLYTSGRGRTMGRQTAWRIRRRTQTATADGVKPSASSVRAITARGAPQISLGPSSSPRLVRACRCPL